MSAARTRWGYHELRDGPARALVRSCGIRRRELVVDIGAGRGALTDHLLRAGARVIAVELHPGRAAALRARVAGQPCTVVELDITAFRFPERPFRLVANPPFAVLAEVLRRLTAPHTGLVRADLVVPAYVAGRWTRGAHPATRRFDATATTWLPAGAFSPPATQPVAVMTLCRRNRQRQ